MPPAPLGRGFKDKIPSILLKDFVTNVVSDSPSHSTPPPSALSGTPYPITHYINCAYFSANYLKFIEVVSTTEPKSFKEAMRSNGWKESMQAEIKALIWRIMTPGHWRNCLLETGPW